MKKLLLSLTITLFLTQCIVAQKSVWKNVTTESLSSQEKLKRDSNPSEFEVFALDLSTLKTELQRAPSRDNLGQTSNVILEFPKPDGKLESYRIYESSVMHPDLAARYQDIKTYVGQGIEDPSASISISTTLFGLHTMTLSGKNGTFYVDPYTVDLKNYMVYSKNKLTTTKTFSCNVLDANGNVLSDSKTQPNTTLRTTDGKFRTYRLAMACTIEYALFHVTAAGLTAGTAAQKTAAVLAAMVVSVARIDGVYEREMSLTMQLVPNNNLIIFVASDSFNNTNANTLINQSQTVIDGAIGSANYDIGHTVSTGGGGLAQLGCTCVNSSKARGITGSTSPVGDPYDIDYVAHEMGHEFGANHTFTGNQGSCAGNANNSTAVEPGSGTTIMAYAGICSPQDVQQHSDDYFHAVSLAEIFAHISPNSSCVPGVANNNAKPVIPTQSSYTIPNGTAFKLTAVGVTDPNGDALSYCWEQNNLGSVAVPSATSTSGTNFRSLSPTTSPTRFFPSFSDVLAGNLVPTWEKVPTVARTLNFTLTARDNRSPNGGQTNSADMTVAFSSGAPFAITSQAATGITWAGGTTQTITWNTGGVSVPATTAVKISLSIDGGITFPIIIAASTPSASGTYSYTVPSTISAPFCRIMIEPLNNIYYAVNSKEFAIGYSVVQNPCATYSDTVAFPIVTQPAGNYTTRTLTVPTTAGTISSIKVYNTITHAYLSDVQTDISSPLNPTTFVKLFNRSCGNTSATLNLIFNDATPVIDCALTTQQTVSPDSALSAFVGQNPTGNWTFRVYDNYTGDDGTMNSWKIEICTQTITNLSNQDFGLAEFTLFPNPNKGNFTVQFNSTSNNDVNIAVHDLRGRTIFNKKYTNSGMFTQNLQLDNVQSGVYLVTVQEGENKVVKRIIVE